jgi:hypothetical protein
LLTGGGAALWEQIREFVGSVPDMVIGAIKSWLITAVIKAAITKLAMMFNPVGAIIQAILTIYRTVMFLIENINRILDFVQAVFESIANIARGNIRGAANLIEGALVKMLVLLISFLARFAGVSGITEKIKEFIKNVQDRVDQALDKLIEKVVAGVKKVVGTVRSFLGVKAPAPRPGEAEATGPEAVREAVTQRLTERLSTPHDRDEVRATVESVGNEFRGKGLTKLEIGPVAEDGTYPILAATSPLAPAVVMATAPSTRYVRLAATVTFTKEVTLAPRRFAPTGLGSPIAVSGAGFGTGHLIFPGQAPETTEQFGAFTAPVTSKVLQLAAWNFGMSEPDRVSNKSHAENQFIGWLWSELRRDLPHLESIRLLISHSPCQLCSRDLCTDLMDRRLPDGTTLREKAQQGQFSMTVDYQAPYYGQARPLSTTVEDITGLQACLIAVNAVGAAVTLTDAQRDRIRAGRWGFGEVVAGRVRGPGR